MSVNVTEHALKISECFANDCIHTIVCIDGTKFNLVSEYGTTDSFFQSGKCEEDISKKIISKKKGTAWIKWKRNTVQ